METPMFLCLVDDREKTNKQTKKHFPTFKERNRLSGNKFRSKSKFGTTCSTSVFGAHEGPHPISRSQRFEQCSPHNSKSFFSGHSLELCRISNQATIFALIERVCECWLFSRVKTMFLRIVMELLQMYIFFCFAFETLDGRIYISKQSKQKKIGLLDSNSVRPTVRGCDRIPLCRYSTYNCRLERKSLEQKLAFTWLARSPPDTKGSTTQQLCLAFQVILSQIFLAMASVPLLYLKKKNLFLFLSSAKTEIS